MRARARAIRLCPPDARASRSRVPNAAAAARGQRVGLGAEVLLAALREQIAATPDSLDDDETFSESVGKVVQIRRLAADAEEFDGGSSGAYTPMG